MAGEVDTLRQAGFSEDEITAHLAPKVAALQAAGFGEEEISKNFGVKPVKHEAAEKSLGGRIYDGLAKAAKTVTAGPIAAGETAVALATSFGAGFPAYLVGGVGGLIARHTYSPDTDPKVIAQMFSEAVTYNPRSDTGKQLTDVATYPFQLLTEFAERQGKAVADKTGNAPLAAITDETIKMLPFVLAGSLVRSLKGRKPDNSEFHQTAEGLIQQQPPRVPVVEEGPAAVSALEVAAERPRDPQITRELRANLQETYEKTGIDPETLAKQAKIDPTVLEDLASTNIVVPRAAGGPPPSPPAPPAPPAAPAAPPPGTPAAAQAAVLARVSTGEVPVREYTWEKFYIAAKDDLYPVAKIEKALAQGGALPVAESPYHLARLVRGAAGKATQFLDHGTFDFNTYRNTGPGLKQILEPVNKDLEGIRAYMVARRAIELDDRGIVTAVPIAEARQVVANGAAYERVFEQAVKYQNEVTRYLKDSGLLSEEAYAAMLESNKDYVPFFRVFEEEAGKAPGKGFTTFNPIRAIKGSERLIVDPIESIIKNTYLYTALAERNAVGKAFGELVARDTAAAEALGIEKVKTKVKPIEVTDPEIAAAAREQGVSAGDLEAFTIFRPNAMQPAPNQIRYYEGGRPVTLKVPPEVADAFRATDKESAGILLKMVSFPAKTLRAGAILSPDFIARNPLRDQYEAFINSKAGYVPVYDLVRGAMSIAKKDGEFQNWLKSGGANSALVSLDREYLQQHMKALDKDTGIMQRSWNVVTSPIEILRITSELMENATRLGEFKRAKAETKAQIQAAGFESREVTLDFQRMGAQTRGLNMIAAFFNASVEGMDRSVRAVKDNPVAVSAKIGAAITLPSILLWYANNNTPERQARWREVPNWQRDIFWIVMTDEHTYRIPKPHAYGVLFGSSAERMLDQFAADKPDAMKDFMKSIGEMTAPGVMPTGAVPLLEHMTNHSFFTGKPLIPSRMENILPEYQYQEYTTQTSRVLGQMVGAFPGLHDKSIASPIVIDNYIRGWTGGLGAYARDLLDWDLRKLGVLPDPPQPLATLADIPVVRAFVVRYPSATAQSVQDFYDKHSERKKVYDTFQYLVRNGDPEAAIKEAQLDTGAFARLDGISDSMREMNSIIRMVHRHPDMEPSDKRQLIDSMYGMMIEMARAGNEAMREVDKILGVKDEGRKTPSWFPPPAPTEPVYKEKPKPAPKVEPAPVTPQKAERRVK